MDVLIFETCWALNNEIIKQVTSVDQLVYLYSTIKMMHDPINIRLKQILENITYGCDFASSDWGVKTKWRVVFVQGVQCTADYILYAIKYIEINLKPIAILFKKIKPVLGT